MLQLFRRLATGICLCGLLAGLPHCKKSDTGGTAPGPAPAVTAKGSPNGTATQQVIGPAGGTVQSADGRLSINVPPGAVSGETTFGIQPITNTLLGDAGKAAFRLTPEGTVFSQPVEVVYHYTAAGTAGTLPELLIAGYQTAEGTWKAVPAKVNKTRQQLSFKTTHFSDWAINAAVELKASKKQVQVGDKVELAVTGLLLLEDDLLAPLYQGEIRGWLDGFDWALVNHFGSIDYNAQDASKATYTPDHPAPGAANKAEISVTCKGNIKVKDDTAPGGLRSFKELILLTSIDILGEVFMAGDFGEAFTMTEISALMANGRIYVVGHSAKLSVSLEAFGFQADGYPSGERGVIGKSYTHAGRTVGTEVFSYGSEYTECGPPRVQRFSPGVLNIKKWGKVGEPVEGSFSGTLYTADGTDGNGCTIWKERSLNVTFKTVRSL